MERNNKIYLENHSLSDLLKIARANLRDMEPHWKRDVTDRVLEIIEERIVKDENSSNRDGAGHFVADEP